MFLFPLATILGIVIALALDATLLAAFLCGFVVAPLVVALFLMVK